MITPADDTSQPMAELVSYLFTRREAILNQWRSACDTDPALGNVSPLSREEFNNLLPLILDNLEERLLKKASDVDPGLTAQAHGLHRWHKAHSLVETLNELNHLTQTINGELKLFSQLFPQFDRDLLLEGQQQISQLMQETVMGSLQKYDELQRLQATNRADTLQGAVDQLQELSQQRGIVLRESTHDLRGSLSVISSAATFLNADDLSQEERQQFVSMLSRNLTNVHSLLTSLMDLSRLEASREPLQIESVNAGQLLQEIVAGMQSMAQERDIMLRADGPASLVVDTDRVKLQRIVQNLLLNALKYTRSTSQHAALVSVSWSMEGTYRC